MILRRMIPKEKLLSPCLSKMRTLTEKTLIDKLIQYDLPRFQSLGDDYFFQKGRAPLHYLSFVRVHLEIKTPKNWIGRCRLTQWRVRSLD